jgi:predicted tellurium resistance membrane protein TerC
MQSIFTTEALVSLLPLTLMEILLGIDNVIFVSIILTRLNVAEAKRANLWWMIVGIAMRILFLLTLTELLKQELTIFTVFDHAVTLKDIIMLAGGLFLLVNSTLEIHNKLEGEDPDEVLKKQASKPTSFKAIMTQIIIIDMVFSIDGIVTAIGMANNMIIMVIAISISMLLMFLFAPKIATFIHQHPTFKILALSFLTLIAMLLIIDGIHIHQIEVNKGYIYFTMAFSFAIEIINLKVRKKTKAVELRVPDGN